MSLGIDAPRNGIVILLRRNTQYRFECPICAVQRELIDDRVELLDLDVQVVPQRQLNGLGEAEHPRLAGRGIGGRHPGRRRSDPRGGRRRIGGGISGGRRSRSLRRRIQRRAQNQRGQESLNRWLHQGGRMLDCVCFVN